jgi:hypothetical protein
MTCGMCDVPIKRWYYSKTIWVNGIALIATLCQAKWGFIVSPELQGIILTIINVVLRSITKEQIEWKEERGEPKND